MTRAAAVLVALAVGPSVLFAHDHTLPRFEKQQRVAQIQVREQMLDVAAETETAALTLTLLAAPGSTPLAGLVRIEDVAAGKPLKLPDAIFRANGWHSVVSGATVTVPRRRLRLAALQGIETEAATADVDLTGRATGAVTLRLVRLYDSAARGWAAGNTHLHLRGLSREDAARYLQTVSRSDALDVLFVSHLERAGDDADYVTNTFTAADLERLSAPDARLAWGEEHRHNFGRFGEGYGHVMFLMLKELIRPVSLGVTLGGAPADEVPLRRGIQAAREQGATVIWCHGSRGLEDVPNWIEGGLQALNIFDGNPEGTYEDAFYRYLDAGLRVPFSTGTDWFVYDFARAYVPLRDRGDARGWLAALTSGRSFITNGPLLELEADGRAIGDTIALDAPRTIRVRARGVGRVDFGALELVRGGEVVARADTRAAGPHFEATLDVPLALSEPAWLALRIPITTAKTELGQPLFAHTSAVYAEVAGRRVFRPGAADAMQKDVEAAIATITEKGAFSSEAEREGVLGLYRRALATLSRWRAERPLR